MCILLMEMKRFKMQISNDDGDEIHMMLVGRLHENLINVLKILSTHIFHVREASRLTVFPAHLALKVAVYNQQ